MKISLAWMAEYFKDKSLLTVSPEVIASRFNQVTAEIEHWYSVTYPIDRYSLVRIEAIQESSVGVISLEWNTGIVELPLKAKNVVVGELHLVVRADDSDLRWASGADLFADKDFELPAFSVFSGEEYGGWKERIDATDVIFEVDNKSITNRPDLWGHYGLAREIASFLDMECCLLPEADVSLVSDAKSIQIPSSSITIKNSAPEVCSVYAACYFSEILSKPSEIAMAFRLMRIGSKPMQAVVDITNYILYDLGQPMHAYNANEISGTLEIRLAVQNESVELLSGIPLTVTNEDLVIADAEKILCLAGIKGAVKGSMDSHSHPVLVEAATFHAATIRRSAARHKIRTDSSARFEKTLDEARSISAIKRFVYLAEKQHLLKSSTFSMASVGRIPALPCIHVEHSFLVNRSGIALTHEDVIKPLTAMGFLVATEAQGSDMRYSITVPSWRASKDIRIREDILEEVVRHYGFDKIPVELPPLIKKPGNLHPLLRMRALKRYLAFSADMMEVSNYAYIDEQILDTLGWKFENPVEMINPVSETQRTLVQSLLPALFNTVMINMHESDQLRFFESGRCMRMTDVAIVEEKKLAAVFFNKRGLIDFYEIKKIVEGLCTVSGLHDVVWKQVQDKKEPWMRPYRTAELWWREKFLGYAGMINQEMLTRMGGIEETSGFCFEIVLQPLLEFRRSIECKPLSKYQGTTFDLACMVPRNQTVASLQAMIASLDSHIQEVFVFDFYEKKEWHEVRSVGFRVLVQSHEQTLTKEGIDVIRSKILTALAAQSVTLRS